MKTRKFIYLLGGCALLLSGVVSAYVLLTPERTWQSAPTYIVDNRGNSTIADNDRGATATVNAILSNDAWNNTDAGTVVHATKGNISSFTLGDGIPMLNFEDPTGACDGTCLAATFTGYYERQGRGRSRSYRIFDADIVTNTAYNWTSENEDPNGSGCSNEFYIEGVQVHEIGHGLGLGHTNVGGATMFPSVSSCNNGPATIEADDANGILALYGSGGGGSCELGQAGESCTANNQCCSGKCRGKTGNKSCR